MLSRRTYIEINLKKYIENLKKMYEKSGSKVIPVVKSNAYGCGAVEIAKASEEEGIDFIAVAFLEEAEKLRESGIKSKILIFNAVFPEILKRVVNKNYILTIYSIEQIKNYIKLKKEEAVKIKYHININTGMNNLGIDIEEIDKLSEIIKKNKLEIEGIYTHFSTADIDEKNTENQFKKFKIAEETLKSKGIKFEIRHAANSAGAILYNLKYKLDYIRSGMALYGIQPSDIKKVDWIKNIATWKSTVSKIRKIEKGECVNYGKKFCADRDTKIAVIPVGYGDGYKMTMADGGYVLIKNRKCYLKGVICMDQITVEIPDDLEVKEGEEVILMGGEGKNILSIEKCACIAKTIPDDIICSISKEIPRIYIRS